MRTLFFLFTLVCASAVGAQAIQVTTRPFAEVAVYPEYQAFGTVISLNDSRIAAEISARIVDIPVEVGQVVAKGATLARLDSRDFALAAERASAALQSARSAHQLAARQLERARALVADGFISPEALNKRETEAATAAAQLKAAETDLATARRNVHKCLIRAPFKAIIKERIGQVGELATPGAALVRVLDAGRIEISARVRPDYVPSLEKSKDVNFVTRNAAFPAKLHRIVPALDQRERNQEARLRFQKSGALPGTAGTVTWQAARTYLPPDFILRRNGKLGVFVAVDGKASFVALPDAEEGRPAAASLDAAAAIILDGRYQLQDATPVSIAPMQ